MAPDVGSRGISANQIALGFGLRQRSTGDQNQTARPDRGRNPLVVADPATGTGASSGMPAWDAPSATLRQNDPE